MTVRLLPSRAAGAATLIAALTAAALAAPSVTPPAGAAAGPARPARTLLLANGDRVLAPSTGGASAGEVLPGSSRDQTMSLNLGGQSYRIPAAALPYLGHGLDPDLFRLSALARWETGGRLPVRVSYRGRVPTLPGVTLTREGHGVATGYLTAASALQFGAALDRQYRADHARARYGQDGLFARGTRLALAGPPPTAAPVPAGGQRLHTLTMTATNLSGKPDTGDSVIVINAGNSNIFGSNPEEAVSFFYHGVAKYSVPAGTYWAVAEFSGSASGLMPVSRVVVAPQFSVTRNATEHLAERSASSRVTMATPHPAAAWATNFWVLRSGRSGPATLAGWANVGSPMWVSPSSRIPTVGGLSAFASQELASPASAKPAYRYVLNYRDPAGVISKQHYLARPADLATVHENYYLAQPDSGYLAFYGSLPDSFQGYVEPALVKVSLPTRLTAYFGGNMPRMTWASYVMPDGAEVLAGQRDLFRPLPAGHTMTEDWNAYPLHTGIFVSNDEHSFLEGLTPSATRAGDTLRVGLVPFSDNQAGHLSDGLDSESGVTTGGTWQLDQNGSQIASGKVTSNNVDGWFATHATLSPSPSSVGFALTVSRTGAAFPFSTTVSTAWTWRSAHQSAGKLPGNWYCYLQGNRENQNCAVQPMMTLEYAVPGMSLTGQIQPGHRTLDLTVGHLQLVKPITVTGATASVSFDGGKTWHQAQVSGKQGHYQAAFTAPAGAWVMTRVTAHDAAGGSVTETITHAFRVAS